MLLSLLLPVPCAGCGVEGASVCGACVARLAPRPTVRDIPGAGGVNAGLAYDGVARAVLLAMKDGGRPALAACLAPAFAAAVAASPVPDDAVPVPTTRAAYRRRGHDPVALLAARAGIRVSRLFEPARSTTAQKTLAREERARNLAGALRLARPVAGRRILLLDDVVTTGATLAAAARVIRAAGGEVVGGAVLATTPRRRDGSAGTLSQLP